MADDSEENPISGNPQELQDSMILASQKNLFGFLGMIYDRVRDGYKLPYKNLSLRAKVYITCCNNFYYLPNYTFFS